MKVKLYKLEKTTARGNESANWGREVKGLNAYFERDDHKKYILHFCETRVCAPVIVFDGAGMKLDGYTLIGFKRGVGLGKLREVMTAQVRDELRSARGGSW